MTVVDLKSMKNSASFIIVTSIAFIFSSILPATAISPNSTDYKQAQTSAKINLKACRKNPSVKVNGKCSLFNAISDENSEAYKLVDGNWQHTKLQMFDNAIFGRVSLIEIVEFDKEWAYGFTNNKTLGKKLFRFRTSTIHYNYGC
jgi:hypothetical protein